LLLHLFSRRLLVARLKIWFSSAHAFKFCCSGVFSISHSKPISISDVVAGFSSDGSFSPVHLDLWYRLPAVESMCAAFMKENTIYVAPLNFAG
jgi:hypothetical protein